MPEDAPLSFRPTPAPVQLIARGLLRLAGWRIQGEPLRQAHVLACGHHTSNADFWLSLLVTRAAGFQPRFLAKASLFKPPMGGLLLRLGGVPVERMDGKAGTGPGRLVHAAAALLKNGEVVALMPGGQRAASTWRSGFLHMARRGGVPVALMSMDYRRRTVTFFPPQDPGRTEADAERLMEVLRVQISDARGRRPEGEDTLQINADSSQKKRSGSVPE